MNGGIGVAGSALPPAGSAAQSVGPVGDVRGEACESNGTGSTEPSIPQPADGIDRVASLAPEGCTCQSRLSSYRLHFSTYAACPVNQRPVEAEWVRCPVELLPLIRSHVRADLGGRGCCGRLLEWLNAVDPVTERIPA